MDKLLIIGTIPPPIGGVSIHVSRLLERIELTGANYEFVDLKRNSLFKIVISLSTHKNIHLHSSNSYFLFLTSLFCFVFRKRLMFTFHGNVGRFGFFRNLLDNFSIWLAAKPLVINNRSFELAHAINSKTELISAFIPPLNVNALESKYASLIHDLKGRVETLFCTNAFNTSYDKFGKEIYQISDIVKLFQSFNKIGLILSDPSGNYLKLLKKMDVKIGENVIIIPEAHDFNAVIKLSDCMLRFTTTDGDSISVKESLLLGKPVIASNVVDRPKQVILIENTMLSLENAIKNFRSQEPVFTENGFEDLFKLYRHFNMIKT